jgi:hypothetical protein
VFAVGITLAKAAAAGVPQTINYQGYLTNADGSPVNGAKDIVFSLYTSLTGTETQVWTETQNNVTVTKGKYSVVLGSIVSVGLSFDAQYYLGIKIGTDPEMTPRQALTSTGYALRAKAAENLVSTVPTGTAPLTVTSTTLVVNLNADYVDGLHAAVAATPSTLVARNANGYIFGSYFNMTADIRGSNPSLLVGQWDDNYLRYVSPANVSVGYAVSASNSDTVNGLRFEEKYGNNGSVTCELYCKDHKFSGWSGACIAGFSATDSKSVGCGVTTLYEHQRCICLRL